MTDIIRKLIPVEVKEVGDRTLEMAGSTEDKDRMGDIIRASGWKLKNFKKNPVFMWAHRYDDPPIGRATKTWIDKETNRLMFNIEFAPAETYEFADTIFKLYKGGFLHATSVGFMPLDWEGKDEENPSPKWNGNEFTSQDLLELSGVPVPANPNALVSARDQGLITVKEFEALTKDGDQIYTVPIAIEDAEDVDNVTKPEETENQIRIPVKGEEGKHKDHRIRTIDIDKKKGIKALYCGECKKVITYLFDKDKGWTMASAQEWVDEHSKTMRLHEDLDMWLSDTMREEVIAQINEEMEDLRDERKQEIVIPEPKIVSQAELGDELDFILQAIKEVGLNDEQMPAALDLANEILMRAPGSDIPVDILSKVGTVLDDANKERLTQITQLAQEVFDSTITEEGEKQVPPVEIDPLLDTKQRTQDLAEVANLVIAKLKGKRIPK